MDPNTAMETIGAGAKAATKLGEIVEKVFGPRWTRKQADADAYSDQRKLQTIRENPGQRRNNDKVKKQTDCSVEEMLESFENLLNSIKQVEDSIEKIIKENN